MPRSFTLFEIIYKYDYEGCSFEDYIMQAGVDPADDFASQDMVSSFMNHVRHEGGIINVQSVD